MPRARGWFLSIAACTGVLAAASSASAAPRRGDWEASGANNARGSFSVAVVRQHHKRVLAIKNLAVDAPITCINAPDAVPGTDVEVVTATLPINSHGKFSGGKIKKGNGTVVSGSYSHRRFRLTYRHRTSARNPFEGGKELCDTGRVRLVAHPGHRVTVTDGVWLGVTGSGEPIEFNVAAGGRALTTPPKDHGIQKTFAFQVQPASGGDNCAGSSSVGYGSGSETGSAPGASFSISYAIFVDAPGTFNNSELQFGDGPAIAGAFSSGKRASGSFSNPGAGCSGPEFNWSASPQ